METTYSQGNCGRMNKHEFEFVGHSRSTGMKVYHRMTTTYNEDGQIVFPRYWDGFYNEDGSEYLNDLVTE